MPRLIDAKTAAVTLGLVLISSNAVAETKAVELAKYGGLFSGRAIACGVDTGAFASRLQNLVERVSINKADKRRAWAEFAGVAKIAAAVQLISPVEPCDLAIVHFRKAEQMLFKTR